MGIDVGFVRFLPGCKGTLRYDFVAIVPSSFVLLKATGIDFGAGMVGLFCDFFVGRSPGGALSWMERFGQG